MHRDPSIFPSDENGDILWSAHLAGDHLAAIRDVHFSVLFISEASANSCAAEMRAAAFEVHVDECLETDSTPAWRVVAAAHIIPSHERVSAVSNLISSIAMRHDGVTDGWATELSLNNSFEPKPNRGSA